LDTTLSKGVSRIDGHVWMLDRILGVIQIFDSSSIVPTHLMYGFSPEDASMNS
jgi:hypothetical protein